MEGGSTEPYREAEGGMDHPTPGDTKKNPVNYCDIYFLGGRGWQLICFVFPLKGSFWQ